MKVENNKEPIKVMVPPVTKLKASYNPNKEPGSNTPLPPSNFRKNPNPEPCKTTPLPKH